jgi:hypothetical protein
MLRRPLLTGSQDRARRGPPIPQGHAAGDPQDASQVPGGRLQTGGTPVSGEEGSVYKRLRVPWIPSDRKGL